MSRSLVSGAATPARTVRKRLALRRQSRIPQQMCKQTRDQRLAAQLEEFRRRVADRPCAANPFDDRADIGFRQRRGGIDPVKNIEPARRRTVWARMKTRCPIARRAASTIGLSSAAGSSTTAEPVQVNKVETALVVLNEPDPAMTSE